MEIEEYGLANVMRTGYADGGMSAAQEKAAEEYQKNDDDLIAITSEIADAEAFIGSARFLGEDMAKLLRQHYAYKKDDIQYAKDLAKLRMWGCKI